MAMSRANLIMHPVRMHLLATLAHRELNTRQLSRLLPDVPQATLYHHLALLVRAGLLRIVSERRIRGAVEKVYTLAQDNATLGQADLTRATRNDHLRYFTVYTATVLSDFTRYVQQQAPIDPVADGVGYHEVPLYLSEDEFARATMAISRALLPFLSNQPSPARRRRLFALATFPDTEPPDTEPAAETPVEPQQK